MMFSAWNTAVASSRFRQDLGKISASSFMLLYAGYMECTVHLLASMPVCYIYRQQKERQPSRPMAGRKNHEYAVRHHP